MTPVIICVIVVAVLLFWYLTNRAVGNTIAPVLIALKRSGRAMNTSELITLTGRHSAFVINAIKVLHVRGFVVSQQNVGTLSVAGDFARFSLTNKGERLLRGEISIRD